MWQTIADANFKISWKIEYSLLDYSCYIQEIDASDKELFLQKIKEDPYGFNPWLWGDLTIKAEWNDLSETQTCLLIDESEEFINSEEFKELVSQVIFDLQHKLNNTLNQLIVAKEKGVF